MIFYTKKKVDVMQQNTITLVVPAEGMEDSDAYIVLSRDVYDAAVILGDRFGGDYTQLEQKLTAKRHPEAVKAFLDRAPRQIRMLAPFFHLVDEVTEVPESLEGMCGYLHVMSMAINFVSYVSVPENVRNSVQFSGHQLDSYVDSWEAFNTTIKVMDIGLEGLTKEFFTEIVKNICGAILDEVGKPSQPAAVQPMPYPVMQPMVYGQQFAPQPSAYPAQPIMQPANNQQQVQQPMAVEEEEDNGEEDIWGDLAGLLGDDIEQAEKELAEAEEKQEEEKKEMSEAELKAKREQEIIDKFADFYGGGFKL